MRQLLSLEAPDKRPIELGIASAFSLGFYTPYLILALLTFALRLPGLHVPLDRDEGGFAYIAQTWQQGHLPYRDAFDNKPPLLYGLYRAAIAAFGSTPEALHLFWVFRVSCG